MTELHACAIPANLPGTQQRMNCFAQKIAGGIEAFPVRWACRSCRFVYVCDPGKFGVFLQTDRIECFGMRRF